jgi:cell division protein FtsA
MGKRDDIIVGLDIGTTKICAIVGAITNEGNIDIIGIGSHPSKGLKKGVVINIESTVASIKQAVEEAELMAGCEIGTVYAGIAGGHIKGFNSHGIVAVKNKEVSENDIERVLDAAKAVAIPLDREVLHILPQEFIVDDQDGIKEPLGMSGVRLEAKVHIVTAAVSSAQNIIKCANRTGLNVADICLEQLASSEAVLSQDEKDIGVVLVDIGGGTSDLVIYHNGSIAHTAVLSLGGDHLTNDIAVGLRTPRNEAEIIKRKFGCAQVSRVKKDDIIEVPAVGEKVRVMIKEIDEKGRLNLSIKAADPEFASRKGLQPQTNGPRESTRHIARGE